MNDLRGIIIFTDLDGTLLDHETYSFEPAKKVLTELSRNSVPVIPVTSKTRAELLQLRQQLDLDTPFVIENGAAIFVPKGYFGFNDDTLVDMGSFWCKTFAPSRETWGEIIDRLPQSLRSKINTFSELGDEGVAKLTGLSLANAQLANSREFSEPMYFEGSSEDEEKLVRFFADQNLDVLVGGRFLHLTSGYDKGQALVWLKQQFRRQWPEVSVKAVALGDSGNDVDMLEAADQAIIIRNNSAKPIQLSAGNEVIRSLKSGPTGWAATINSLLNLNLE